MINLHTMIGPVVVQVFVSYTDRLNIDMSVYRTDGVYPNLPSIKMDEEKHFLSILGGSHSSRLRPLRYKLRRWSYIQVWNLWNQSDKINRCCLFKITQLVHVHTFYLYIPMFRSQFVLVAFCVPRNAEIIFEYRMENLQKREVRPVTSRQAVVDDEKLGTYFYDSTNG